MFFHRIAHSSLLIEDERLVPACADIPVNSSKAYGLLLFIFDPTSSFVESTISISCGVIVESLVDRDEEGEAHSWGRVTVEDWSDI